MRVKLESGHRGAAHVASNVELARASGYFIFRGEESEDWIDRTVAVPTIGSLTLEQWINEYHRLKEVNQQILDSVAKLGAVRSIAD